MRGDVPDEVGNRASARRRAPRPTLIIVSTVIALLLGGGVVIGLLLFDGIVRERIVKEARRRGVLLDGLGDVSVWFSSASLEDVDFRLEGVNSLRGKIRRIDVVLADWEPTRLNAEGIDVAVIGSAANVALELGGWTARHPKAYALPVSARAIRVAWRSDESQPPWLAIENGSMTEAQHGILFSAQQASLYGIDVGAVGASWSADVDSVTLSFGAFDPEQAQLRLVVEHASTTPQASIRLNPIPLEQLAGPLGVALPVQDVSVSGTVDLEFQENVETGPVTGSMDIELDGFIPPHPVELSGFIFGRTTSFTTEFTVNADRRSVDLTSTRIAAGAFRLRGGGSIERQETHAMVQMDLSGNLGCAAVADSAAKARLGTVLGRLLGKAAKQILDGSVAIRIKILADTRDLTAARVERRVGVGCGLRPLDASDLEKLGVPKELARLADELPDLPSQLPKSPAELAKMLPPIPSALPPIPTRLSIPSGLPKFPLPRAEPQRAVPTSPPPER